ncbi:MAG: hypothetical protein LUM44_03635 [Pyrinomonadaceae bacterium]|nr:hypothetical protein [Pyrinomonadaceae bacterium]
MSETNFPFRWKIESPDELGSLIKSDFELNEQLLSDVRYCAARILAFSQNSRLVFVGRSLDSVHDYLTAILENTSWHNRLLRLNISLYGQSIDYIRQNHPKSFALLKKYFEELVIDPTAIKSNKIPTSFVDVVYEGGTYEQIFRLLNDWSDELENGSAEMNKKIRFIGITLRKKTSPNTWRWQQQTEWTKYLKSSNIKNISMDYGFWHHVANYQPKITKSFTPKMWETEESESPNYSEETIKALNEAHCLYNAGKSKNEKQLFVKELLNKQSMKLDWLRNLALEIKT